MLLSKTDFLIYKNCRKNAWLKLHRPDIYREFPLSSFELNIIETGNEIDELARDLFPGGVTIDDRADDAYTKELIEKQTPVIYQPLFKTDQYITACDILVWNTSTNLYDLYEVKSSTASGDGESSKRKTKDYLVDMAFQKIVLDDLSTPLGTINLIRLNKEYVRNGELDIHELFLIEDHTGDVTELANTLSEEMADSFEYLSKTDEPDRYCDCLRKGRAGFCTTASYSNSFLPEYPIHDISRIGNTPKKFGELIDMGIYDIHDIPEGYFPEESNYNLQVEVAQTNTAHIDQVGIREFMDKIQYPISYLDYETFPSAIPRFDGYRPYQQIPFQFSLHVQESPDTELIHHEFLFTETTPPDQPFFEALQKHLPNNGSIVVWNKTFECKIINEKLMDRIPESRVFLEDLNNRVVDLMLPFQGLKKENLPVLYQHKDQRGSASIKKVLPVLVPELSYANLDIQEGGTASDTWNRIVSGEFIEKEKNSQEIALKKYCELDTFAMVEIYKQLKNSRNFIFFC